MQVKENGSEARAGLSKSKPNPPVQVPLRWPFNYLVRLNPLAAALVAAVPGLLCCGLSVWLGVDFVDSPEWSGAVHEVGYLAALNWSLGFTVLAPCAIYYMVASLLSVEPLIDRLRGNGMLAIERPARHESISPNDPGVRRTLTARWRNRLHSTRSVVLTCSVLAIALAAGAWYKNSAGPGPFEAMKAEAEQRAEAESKAQAERQPRAKQTKKRQKIDVDWLVSCRWTGEPCGPVIAFGTLVFAMQSAMMVAFFLFAGVIVAFSMFARELAPHEHPEEAESEQGRIVLVPQATTEDPRRGFEAFERLTESVLLTSAFAFGLFYFSRLWNVYLHSSSGSLVDYALPFLATTLTDGGWKDMIAPFDESGFFATIAGILLFMLALVIPLSVLRDLGQSSVRAAIRNDPTGELKVKLSGMKFWPLAFPGQGILLLAGVTCLLTLWIPAVGIVYFGTLVAAVLRRAYRWFTLSSVAT